MDKIVIMINRLAINCISDNVEYPRVSKIYKLFLVSVVLSGILFALLNNHNFFDSYSSYITHIQTLLYFFLVVDFLLRVIASYNHQEIKNYAEHTHYDTLSAYLFSYYGFVDLIATIPFILSITHTHSSDLLIIMTMLTLLKLSRFSPALIVLKDVILSERDSLLAALYMMMILTFSLSTTLYFIERDINPGFATLFDSIWWAIVTLSTVGYGDVTPHTYLGKLVGGVASISGFGMFALPAGIIASGFAQEIRRLKDVITWEMVTKVPLFSDLEFGAIANIAKLLHIKRFKKNELIIKKGTRGDSMYFILKGSVIVHTDTAKITLSSGDFFGEIALVKNIARTADVYAKSTCELLELTTYDFNNFIKTREDLAKTIETVALTRYAQN